MTRAVTLRGTSWALVALIRTGRSLFSRVLARGVLYLLKAQSKPNVGWPERLGGPVQVWCTHHAIFALKAYLRLAQPIYDAPIGLLFWQRLKAQLVRPLSRFKHTWLVPLLLVAVAALTLVARLGLVNAGSWLAFIYMHGGVIVITAGMLTIVNIIRMVVKDALDSRKRN